MITPIQHSFIDVSLPIRSNSSEEVPVEAEAETGAEWSMELR